MTSIKDEIRIRATAAQAYAALTEQAGYRKWWNTVAEVPSSAGGGEAKLLFDKAGQKVAMRWRIDEQVPNERVRWSCLGHDMQSWVGTTLAWTIKGAGDEVVVALDHAGWAGEGPASVAQGWQHFLGSLKSYLETGTGQPW